MLDMRTVDLVTTTLPDSIDGLRVSISRLAERNGYLIVQADDDERDEPRYLRLAGTFRLRAGTTDALANGQIVITAHRYLFLLTEAARGSRTALSPAGTVLCAAAERDETTVQVSATNWRGKATEVSLTTPIADGTSAIVSISQPSVVVRDDGSVVHCDMSDLLWALSDQAREGLSPDV